MRTGAAILMSLAILATACAGPAENGRELSGAEENSVTLVYVVNYPLAYFAERVGGERVDVRFPAPPGEDPAYWKPDAETIGAYQQADLILTNGAGYAGWIAKATLPASAIVDTSSSFSDRYLPLTSAVTHSHGPEGDHEHGGVAFTTWLDPTLAVEQARAVAEALIKAQPGQESVFRERFASLADDLTALDQRLAAAAERIGDRPLLFSHPVFQYLERRYGLHGRSLHWEPDEEPDLDELRALLAEQPASWMVWEAEPREQTVRALAELGVSSAVFTPCGNVCGAPDYLESMARNASELERIAAPRSS